MREDRFAALPPRRNRLRAEGADLSWLEWGDAGAPLLLLHGITSNAQAWWRVAPRLVQAGFHVFALDMPGHGLSGQVADHRVESMARLVAAAAGELGLDTVTLVGHSWGGSVALALAAAPGATRVERVALLDPALSLTAEAGRARVPMFTKGIGSPVEALVPAIAAANPDWPHGDVWWKAEAMLQCRFAAVEGFFTQSGDWSLTDALGKVQAPLLLLLADAAGTIVDEPTRRAAQRSLGANARLAVVPGTTHNMYRGAGYEPTMAALLGWLGQA